MKNKKYPDKPHVCCLCLTIRNRTYLFSNSVKCSNYVDSASLEELSQTFNKILTTDSTIPSVTPFKICGNCREEFRRAYTFIKQCIKSVDHLRRLSKTKVRVNKINATRLATKRKRPPRNEECVNDGTPATENEANVEKTANAPSKPIQYLPSVTDIRSPAPMEELVEIFNEVATDADSVPLKTENGTDDSQMTLLDELISYVATDMPDSEISLADVTDYEGLPPNSVTVEIVEVRSTEPTVEPVVYSIVEQNDEQVNNLARINGSDSNTHAATNGHENKRKSPPGAGKAVNICCIKCPMQFKTKRGFDYHRRIHPSNIFSCSECYLQFSTYSSFLLHSQTHTGEEFCCDRCGLICNNPTEFNEHKRTHTEEFRCDRCSLICNNPTEFDEHKRMHTEAFCCDRCGSICNNLTEFEEHKQTHHTITKKGSSVKPNSGDRFYCNECEASFTRAGRLSAHKRIHTGDTFDCTRCSKKTISLYDLKLHYRREHPGLVGTFNMKGRLFKITYTPRTTKGGIRGDYSYVEIVDSSDKKIKCSICSRGFTTQISLKRHIAIHSGVKYPCSFCNATYARKAELNVHQRIHTGETFNCRWCDRKTTTRYALKQHIAAAHKDRIASELLSLDDILNGYEQPEKQNYLPVNQLDENDHDSLLMEMEVVNIM